VEIRQGEATVRVPLAKVRELIEALGESAPPFAATRGTG
jgi:hypothetical protein